jgi:eukaryotic-like serine/threonine-protein kinase
MNPEVERLFHQLADLSAEQRDTYLRENHVRNDLRAEVEALLRFDTLAEDPLSRDVAASAGQLLEPRDAMEGLRCGPYQLIRVLGRGGMATVYLARRVDGEVEQFVAVKLIRYGGDESVFRARFQRERQILASLNHPAIAHLLDAGRASNGQPYLAMEYVDGVPIDVYGNKLDLRGKLALFCQICDAVSYAHRNLVVHRDLKPSNILVDREGRPKLLDFGIAKILDAEGPGEEARTATMFQPLTPQYASPEQIRGEAIATTTDVYSLGVVLYKLLTNHLPYEFPTLAPSTVDRTICEVQPAPPHISKDLDNIVLMALRKEPARRYPSVHHLSDDIQRALTNRPVSARPDTLGYRASKFIRRNRIGLAAAGLALLALVAGSAIAIEQARIARQRFQDVRKLAHTFVFDLHDEVAKLEGSTKAREMMVQTGLEYLDDLARNAGGDLELQKEIASGYMKIGDAQGYPTKPNLGRTADAVASYRKAGEIYKRIAAQDSSYLPDLAEYYRRYAGLVRFSSGLSPSREISESAIQTLNVIRARGLADPQFETKYAEAFCTLGDADEDLGRYTLAFQEFSRCGDVAREQFKEHGSRPATLALASAAERIGTAAQENGMLTVALRAIDEDEKLLAGLAANEPRNPDLHRRLALVNQFRASVYYDERFPNLGDPTRSLASSKLYLAAAREMVRSDPNNTSARFSEAIATYKVSYALAEIDANEAVNLARQSVRMFNAMKASHPSYLVLSRRAIALDRLADAEFKAGHIDEAWRAAQSTLDATRSLPPQGAENMEQQMQFVQALILAGKIRAKSEDHAQAESLLRQARDHAASITRSQEVTQLIPLADAEEALGAFYAARRQTGEARACYQKVADMWQRFQGSNEYVDLRRARAARLLASLR